MNASRPFLPPRPKPSPPAAMIRAAHFAAVRAELWRWRRFTPRELACRHCGGLVLDPAAVDALERARELAGRPLVIFSAYRCPAHNAAVGGARRSQHLLGRAFDVALAGHAPRELERLCRAAGFRGFRRYRTFLHVDTGPARRRGARNSWATSPPPSPAASPGPSAPSSGGS